MSVASEEVKAGGALGVFANYIKSSDSVPVVKMEGTAPAGVRNKDSIRMGTPDVLSGEPGAGLPNESKSGLPNSPSITFDTLKLQSLRKSKKSVSIYDIWLKMIGDLTGKDKIAKIALYSMRIILVYAEKYSTSASTYDWKGEKKLPLLVKLLKAPKVLIALLSRSYIKQTMGTISALSVYRQLLRFGKTPFRTRNLLLAILQDVNYARSKGVALGVINAYHSWFNQDRLQEVINFYYGITDELLLLYKIGALTGLPKLRRWAGDHECYSWYMDIILGLKVNYSKLRKLKERELSIRLNQQVREKARQVLKNLKIDNSPSPLFNSLTTELHVLELEQISKERTIVILSILGLLCDFSFDTVDVFNLKVNRAVYLSFGLVSGCCSLTKLYIGFKDQLTSQD